MKQDSKPLWQRLNEERTRGEWEAIGKEMHTPDFFAASFDSGLNGASASEDISNATFTALAVNNLASLAEALQNLIDDVEACKRSGIKPSSDILNIAKEALNKIS